jgi:lipopolysaccharide export system protein LptA
MARNVILLIATLAVLAVGFAGYVFLLDDPTFEDRAGRAAIDELPMEAATGGQTLSVANVLEVSPGEGVELTFYDDQTGLPTQRFVCREWTPVAGTTNEVAVSGPQLKLWLRNGMIATLSAAEGYLTVDRLETGPGQPRFGSLRGDVRIEVDRSTQRDRLPLEQRPDDLLTVVLDDLRFDLDLGEVRSDGPLEIVSRDFELAGTGLDLVWNRVENMVESLRIRQGEHLVLRRGAGLFETPRTAAGSAPAEQAVAAESAYECTLTGQVVVEQYEGERLVGGLTAEQLRLLFDVGRDAGRPAAADGLPYRSEQAVATLAPAEEETRAAPGLPVVESVATLERRLVVQWAGPLRLDPVAPVAGGPLRRQFEADGEVVTLTHADGRVACGRLEYYDETQQVWLHAQPDGRVDFSMGERLAASAGSVYIARTEGVVKLIGDVDLRAASDKADDAGLRTITCSLWAELKLAAAPAREVGAVAGPTELLSYGRLESATFVGTACVSLGEQALSAERIAVHFNQAGEEQSFEMGLRRAVAAGNVRLEQRDQSLESAELEIVFGTTAEGKLYPRQFDATGSVVLARGRSWLRGQRVQAWLAPEPPDAASGGPAFALRTIDITDDAELRDPKNKVAARGRRIRAEFSGRNNFERADVFGTALQPGVVHTTPYTVDGGQIVLDRAAQTLNVDGRARLRFKAARGLAGQRRTQPMPVVVNCDRLLHIDGHRNTVHFEGNVVAESGAEKLLADGLTLLLEDVVADVPPAGDEQQLPPLMQVLAQARQAFGRSRAAGRDDWLDLRGDGYEGGRKEPVRLVAENALVQSETHAPNDPVPVVHSSIGAPWFEVDIVRREIITRGETTLLVRNHRLEMSDGDASEALGLPSALVTDGPSQTAMRCTEGMIYALGPEDATRRDSVLFQGDVVFRHRADLDLLDAQQLLPAAPDDPDVASRVRTRDTWMECDRLECVFVVRGGGAAEPGPAAGQGGMQLAQLLASGNTELRDEQDATVRSVFARRIEFDRDHGVLRVLGTERAHARIYEEDRRTAEVRSLVGEEFVIDLVAGTVRTGPTRGEFSVR